MKRVIIPIDKDLDHGAIRPFVHTHGEHGAQVATRNIRDFQTGRGYNDRHRYSQIIDCSDRTLRRDNQHDKRNTR